MSTELASAYLTLIPSLRGAQRQIQSQLAGVNVSAAGTELGHQMSGAIGKGLDLQVIGARFSELGDELKSIGGTLTRNITVPAVAATGAIAGIFAAKGWGRLVAIDTAKGQFQGLGYEAERVMAQVDKGVTDTSLSMAQGASMAVGILATGAVPLGELEDQIKRVANVSAAYGVDSEHAAYLLNNILTKNKVTWGDLAQMQQNQIPIVSQLADYYGVAGDEIMKMAQDGAISIEDLNTVLDQNAGAAAEAYANTWAGITANIWANVGKIGAAFLEPTFSIVKDEAADLLGFLKSPELAASAEEWGAKLGDVVAGVVDGIKDVIDWWGELDQEYKDAILIAGGIAIAAGPALFVLGQVAGVIGGALSGVGGLVTALGGGGGVAGVAGGALGIVGLVAGGIAGLISASPELRESLGEAFEGLWASAKELAPVLQEAGGELADALIPLLATAGDGVADMLDALLPLVPALVDLAKVVIPPLADALELLVEYGLAPAAELISTMAAANFGGLSSLLSGDMGGFVESMADPMYDLLDLLGVEYPTSAKTAEDAGAAFEESLGFIGDAIKNLLEGDFDALLGMFSDSLTNFEEWFEIDIAFFDTFRDGIAVLRDSLADFTEWWGGIWESVQTVFSTVWEAITAVVSTVWEVITTIFSTAVETVKQLVAGAILFIVKIFQGDFAGAADIARTVWDNIRGIFADAGDRIRSLVGSLIDRVKSLFSNMMNGAKTTVSNGINGVVDFFRNLPDRIVSTLSGLSGQMAAVGRNIIQGMIDGILGAVGGAISAVQGAVGDVIQGAKDTLGIKSPSRVFRDQVGAMIPAGVIAGIEGGQGLLDSAIDGMFHTPDVPAYGASARLSPTVFGDASDGPSQFNLFDSDGQLIGRMRGEAVSVMAGESQVAGRGVKETF